MNKQSLRKILKFLLISWCGNFVETQSFLRVNCPQLYGNCAYPEIFYSPHFHKVFHALNLPLVTGKKCFVGYCLEAFSQLKRKILSNNLYIKVLFLMVISKLKIHSMIILMSNLKFELLWIYFTKRPSKFSTIIYGAKIINEALSWIEMACLDFIRRNGWWYMYSSSQKYRN